DYYLKDVGNMKDIRTAYRAHIGRMFALLGKKPAEAQAAVADVFRIETALAKVQQDKVLRRDPHAIYHRIERKGLEKVARGLPWGELLTRLGIGGVTAITANDPKYYGDVTALMGREKPSALRNYLSWNLINSAAPELSKAFVDENFSFTKALTGVKELP